MNQKQLDFAYKVRQALDESLDNLPPSTTQQLASARKSALSFKKSESPTRKIAKPNRLAGYLGNYFGGLLVSLIARLGLIVPAVVLAIGLALIYQFEQQQQISNIAEIDALVLSDELPLSAYLDHGFNAYLARQGE